MSKLEDDKAKLEDTQDFSVQLPAWSYVTVSATRQSVKHTSDGKDIEFLSSYSFKGSVDVFGKPINTKPQIPTWNGSVVGLRGTRSGRNPTELSPQSDFGGVVVHTGSDPVSLYVILNKAWGPVGNERLVDLSKGFGFAMFVPEPIKREFVIEAYPVQAAGSACLTVRVVWYPLSEELVRIILPTSGSNA